MKVISKPWGQEELLDVSDRYVLKRLTMKAGHRCSLQYHEKKRETIYVLSGRLKIFSGPSQERLEEKVFEPHSTCILDPYRVHRMEAIEDSVYLEASTPELDDVVRITDDYNRA